MSRPDIEDPQTATGREPDPLADIIIIILFILALGVVAVLATTYHAEFRP